MISARISVVARLFLFACLTLGTSRESFAQEIKIQPSSNVEEKLFHLRLLEKLYVALASTNAYEGSEFLGKATALRTTAIRLRERCRRENLNEELVISYDDYLDAVNSCIDLKATIGQITKEVAAQAKKDQFDSGVNAGLLGASAYQTTDSPLSALIAAGASYTWDSWNKGQKRKAEETQAISNVNREVYDAITASLANLQGLARKLERSNSWRRGEAGFDDERTESFNTMWQQGDVFAYMPLHPVSGFRMWYMFEDATKQLRVFEEDVQKRPRDPFARLERNAIKAQLSKNNAAALLGIAQDSLDAAALVPEGEIYEDYRLLCVAFAREIASNARQCEISNGVEPLGSTAASRLAVACHQWLAGTGLRDPGGHIAVSYAWCLLADNQVTPALEHANTVFELRKADKDFAYGYACILSRMNSTEDAIKWLKHAMSLGFNNISHLKRDYDLEAIRVKNNDVFSEITKVKWSWNIEYGSFFDDIVVQNTSMFPLSNVVVVTQLQQDGKSWSQELRVSSLRSGETYRWKDVVSIPGNRLTKAGATLTCDQNR